MIFLLLFPLLWSSSSMLLCWPLRALFCPSVFSQHDGCSFTPCCCGLTLYEVLFDHRLNDRTQFSDNFGFCHVLHDSLCVPRRPDRSTDGGFKLCSVLKGERQLTHLRKKTRIIIRAMQCWAFFQFMTETSVTFPSFQKK